MTTTGAPPRSTPVFALASEYVERLAADDPSFAVRAGLGPVERLPDYSLAAGARRSERLAEFLRRLGEPAAAPTDDADRLAALAMRERLDTELELLRRGEFDRTFGVLRSPVSSVRQLFELLPLESVEDRATVVALLTQVPGALGSWRETLDAVAHRGELPAPRHVEGVCQQAEMYARGSLRNFAEGVRAKHGDARGLVEAADLADRSFGELAATLRERYLPHATAADPVGRERYLPWARQFTGTTIDPDELYAWGWEELQRINQRMHEIRALLRPDAPDLRALAASLDEDPTYLVHGTDELLARLETLVDGAVHALDGVHFDIDPRARHCDVRLAPPGGASAAYYIAPSEDFSRPGSTWYPTMGRTSFAFWRDVTIWYHEGVPGHHLQAAAAHANSAQLSRFTRLAGWISGYGEGWALYAERLMEELGFLSDPAHELGYLSGQALRAARIVVDLGMHLSLRAPADLGELPGLGNCSGRVWDAAMSRALLEDRAIVEDFAAASETDRYLSWPGQAISYKLGERTWLAAREAARARHGDAFSLRAFHKFALDMGPLGLDDFTRELERF